MKILVVLLFSTAPALAQSVFGFPPVNSTKFQVGGVTQTPTPNFVNFGTGLSGSLSGGTLTITTTGGAPVPTSRTLTTTSPLTCDSGASCDLSANRTLAITDVSLASATDTFTITSAKPAGAANIGVLINCTNSPGHCFSVQQASTEKAWINSAGINFADQLGINSSDGTRFIFWNSNVWTYNTNQVPAADATWLFGSKALRFSQLWTTTVGGGSNSTNGHTVPNVADATFVVTASGGVEYNFSAYNTGNLAAAAQFAQTLVTNASTITAGGTVSVQDVVGVGGGNFVTKLCSDGATCGAGNVYVTCTSACTAAVGTVTSCTVNKSAVAATTTLTQSVGTACATTDPNVNINVHFTTP